MGQYSEKLKPLLENDYKTAYRLVQKSADQLRAYSNRLYNKGSVDFPINFDEANELAVLSIAIGKRGLALEAKIDAMYEAGLIIADGERPEPTKRPTNYRTYMKQLAQNDYKTSLNILSNAKKQLDAFLIYTPTNLTKEGAVMISRASMIVEEEGKLLKTLSPNIT